MANKARVLMGTPICDIYEYCLDEYLEALRKQKYPSDILLVDNSEDETFSNQLKKENGIKVIHVPPESKRRETVMKCRNLMIEYAIDNNYDFIFYIDADTIIPKDALEKLMLPNKDVISGVVYNIYQKEGRIMQLPALWTWLTNEEFGQILRNKHLYPEINKKIEKYKVTESSELRRQFTEKEILEPKIIKIKCCGAACLLVSRKVFMDTRFNFDKVGNQECPGEDIGFCNEAVKNGHEIFVNTEVVCKHLIKNKPKNIFYQ